MNVSITGGTGFIGSTLVDALLARGASIRCLIRPSSNLQWLKDKPIEFVSGDLFSEETLRRLVSGADYIYHIAGVVKSKTRDGYFRANRDATRSLLDACVTHATRLTKFVYASSLTAVGPSPSLEAPVTEDSPCAPITTYGESKRAGELVVLDYASQVPVTIVRPPAVYGPRDTEIFIFFQTIQRGLNPLIGFDHKRVSIIHAADLVDGLLLAAESPKSAGRTYFITNEDYCDWNETGRMTARLLGKKRPLLIRIPHATVYGIAGVAQFLSMFQSSAATLNLEKARDLVQRYWTCDGTRAKNELSFRASRTLEQGFAETIAWYRTMGWLK